VQAWHATSAENCQLKVKLSMVNDGEMPVRLNLNIILEKTVTNATFGNDHRLIKYSLDNLRPLRTAETFKAVDWLHQQTWLHCGIAHRDWLGFCKSSHVNVRISVMFSSTITDV